MTTEEPLRAGEFVFVRDALDRRDMLGFTYEEHRTIAGEMQVGVLLFECDGSRPRQTVPVGRVRRQEG